MDTKIFSKQLDDIINTYNTLARSSQYEDLSDHAEADRQSLATRGIAAVNRIAGPIDSADKYLNLL